MKRANFLRLLAIVSVLSMVLLLVFVSCSTPSAPQPQAPSSTTAPTSTVSAPVSSPTAAAKTTTAAPTAASGTKPIVLRAVSFTPKQNVISNDFLEVIKRINAQSNGQLVINYLGGPEAIPSFGQFEALRTGAVQFALEPGGYYMGELPEAYSLMAGKLTPIEKRDSGFYDYYVELHKKLNVRWLGSGLYYASHGFILVSSRAVTNPTTGFKGLKFRIGGKMYDPLWNGLGLSQVNVEWSDVYTSLERKLCEGAGGSLGDIMQWRIYEVAKYIVSPSFYESNAGMLVNLDTWNQLPKNLQDLMLSVMIEVEKEMPAKAEQQFNTQLQALIKNGMEQVKWSDADTKWFMDMAYEVAWQELKRTVSAESYSKIRTLLRAQ